MTEDKSDILSDGEETLHSLDAVGRTSYEGGDGGSGTEWHNDYRVWPADGYDKDELLTAVEDVYDARYLLMPSRADGEDYAYVSVRTTVE